MIVAVKQAPFPLGGQVKIFDPFSGRAEDSAAGAKGHGEIALMHPQTGAIGFQQRIKRPGCGLAVMVAVVHDQSNTQREGTQRRIEAGQKAPGDVGRV